jgi:hypothetical protein
MQRTADFHEQVADARPPQATDVVDDAATLDAAVDVLNTHTAAGDAPIRRFLCPRELSSSRLPDWHDDFHLVQRKRQEA